MPDPTPHAEQLAHDLADAPDPGGWRAGMDPDDYAELATHLDALGWRPRGTATPAGNPMDDTSPTLDRPRDDREALARVMDPHIFGPGGPNALAAADAVLAAVEARVEAALAEHRREWATWLEGWVGAVTPDPPTFNAVIDWLRADRVPFGCAAAE